MVNKHMLLGRLINDLRYYKNWGHAPFQQLSLIGNIEEIEKIWHELPEEPKWIKRSDIDILIKECQEIENSKNNK